MNKRLQPVVIGIGACLINACGGGGGSAGISTNIDNDANYTLSQQTGLRLLLPEHVYQGQSVALGLLADKGKRIASASWQQTSGTEVVSVTSHSQVFAFDVPETGDYTFNVSGRFEDGDTFTIDASFTAASAISVANIRLDHLASEQASASLRVDGDINSSIVSVDWEQIVGPTVSDSETQDQYLFFDTPSVTQDTLFGFRATLTYSNGSEVKDDVYVVVKDVAIDNDGYFPKYIEQVVTSEVYPANADSPYAQTLVDCVYSNLLTSSCRFGSLPLIGANGDNYDVNDVMDHVVVSHPWMAQRFETFLKNSDIADDILQLLGSVTAIVISYDVRPSYYWAASGAIYLDAENVWKTPQERDSLNDEPDYRSDYGSDLQFIMPWRYVKDNDYYSAYSYPVARRLSRTDADIEADLSWLLYHELGHANDFFAPSVRSQVSSLNSPLSYVNDHAPTSDEFSQTWPLASDEMAALAQVRYQGESATSEQMAYTAEDVELFFTPDVATGFYHYSSTREDFATLFERFMMLYRLGVSSDVAILSSVDNDDLLVTWGQRDRVNDPSLQPRVAAAVESIYPSWDVSALQATMPAPVLMTPGINWYDNIELSPTAKLLAAKSPDIKQQLSLSSVSKERQQLWHPPIPKQ